MSLKNRHRLKTKQIKTIIDHLQKTYTGDLFNSSDTVEIATYDEYKVLIINDQFDFFFHENHPFFTLKGLEKYAPKNGYVIVDMGAVRFVTNGADVMAPGIVDADVDIEEGQSVGVYDELHRKPLAIGVAVMNGDAMKATSSGKAVKTIHYVGDKLWYFVNAQG